MKTSILIIIASAVIIAFITGWIIGTSTFYYTDDPNSISERSYMFPPKTTLSETESKELECLRLYKDINEMSRTTEMQLAESETIHMHRNLVFEYVEKDCPDFNDLEFIYNNYKQNTSQSEGECDPGPVLEDGYCYKNGKKVEFLNENQTNSYEVWTTQGLITIEIDKITNTVISLRSNDLLNYQDRVLIEENQKKIIQTVLSNAEIEKLIEGKDYIIFQVRHYGVGCITCVCPEDGCALVGFSTVKSQHLGVTMTVILNPISGEIFDITTSQAWDQE